MSTRRTADMSRLQLWESEEARLLALDVEAHALRVTGNQTFAELQHDRCFDACWADGALTRQERWARSGLYSGDPFLGGPM